MLHPTVLGSFCALTMCSLSLLWAKDLHAQGSQAHATVQAVAAQEAQKTAPTQAPPHEPTAAELSKNETIATALMRTFGSQEYEFRSAAEAMPEEKYGYRPGAPGKFIEPAPFGPTELRTFAEQIKHVACSNFAFAAELDGKKPPDGCDKG